MNSNHIDTTKSTHELKEQVLRDIQKVKDDFTEIQQRMTPGQIIDDALFYRGVKSPSETFNLLRANPVGTTFLTLGTLLLLENEEKMTYEGMAWKRRDQIASKITSVKASVTNNVTMAKGKIAQVRGSVDSVLHRNRGTEYINGDVREGVEASVENFKEQVTQVTGDIKNNISTAASENVDAAKRGIKNISAKVTEMGSSLKTRGGEMIEASKGLDPLTYVALGLGLGTITGAAIPVSAAEERLVHGNFDDKIQRFNQDLQKAMNESVNILKKELIGGVADFDLNLFR